MHKNLEIYYFIDKNNLKELSGIKKKINIIFRDYNRQLDENEILNIGLINIFSQFCFSLILISIELCAEPIILKFL